jgi:hypothetical protein
MERLLNEIVERLQKAHRDKLVSVILYGSGALPDGRDCLSDYNILCVLSRVTPEELAEAEPVFRWWREMKNPSPLLMCMDEVRSSADSFPIEFHDMREQHAVLWGEDVVRDLHFDTAYYRSHLEHELRAKLLRLRQKAGGVLSDRELLVRLMASSISTFCVLFRHALILAGDSPRFEKREVIARTRERFGVDASAFDTLLDLREEIRSPRSVKDSVGLLGAYMNGIDSVIHAVDRMQK